ncbi:S-layer homology domain-containing protein [Paenibacillus xylanilyticus]|uniref:S-layer homology domain-containing protein n=1 Tax=Paenibacillus xylanilyticus TaxID=248903 RepID=A0A7Y6EUE5_9BACL|nr:S-layer homology domain-containing protein [Paenibacillus xylanilyticus]NUU74663.1 S-layer homology domain-containing protein [Paenibacillus xylanilyticus]
MKKQSNKIAGIALAAALVLGTMSITAPNVQAATSQFSDVESNHWGASAITNGVSKGYVDGYTNGTFKPDASVTRAEFVKMVVSAMELETVPSSGKWYTEYVEAASQAGLYASADFNNSEAAWTKVMTRDEMARVAARAIGETSKEEDKWMYLATKAGLIKGVGIGQIAPKGLTTRAQAIVVIERILSKNTGASLEVDKYAVGSAEIAWHGTNIFTVMPEMWVTTEKDLRQARKNSVEEMWNEERMTITSKDGLYQARLDALIAIDLADPNDPNLGLIKPMNTLKWFNNTTNKNLMVKDQKNSYVLYFKGGTVFNKDTKRYNPNTTIQFRVDGFGSPDRDAFFDKGVLNGTASLYRSSYFDVPGVIIPKTGTIQNYSNLEIRLQTPAGGWWFSQIVPLSLRGNRDDV